ncbi:alkylmercury lyase family protein, partial [Nocardia pseudovaccinii]|uniref:alkylmercury lyase family protein n=1 Tax=Nocardia pseudovaccinii TaxID=189540 RepID=UPI0007A3CF0E
MKLEILQVPDCPNAAVLEERIRQALTGELVDIEVIHRVLDTTADAAAAGMTGSPTLLVDGSDPFAVPGQEPSLSCRLYPSDTGGLGGAPSIAALRRALDVDTSQAPPAPAVAADCCAPASGTDSAAWMPEAPREAARPSDPAERALHYAILQTFATQGRAPVTSDLTGVAAEYHGDVDEVLGRLHDADVIRLDSSGNIAAAYPFSASPTPHRVRITGGATVYAICAIDALGIPAMLDTDVVIESVDPSNDRAITVTVQDSVAAAQPQTTVVFVGAQAAQGPSADTCCNYLNFFTDRQTAQAWMAAHPHIGGVILDLTEAQH